MKFNQLINLFILVAVLSSCVSNKKIVYMQELEDGAADVYSSKRYAYNEEKYKLQNFDIVEINIKTSSEELNAIFSIITGDQENMNMNMGQSGGDVFFMNGYSLDEEGNVEIPLLGKVNLEGLNTEEAKTLIEQKVQPYVTADSDYFVRVRLGGIRFSALGEFNSPGKITVLQNRVTIFEALAAAGDLTVIAKRDEITLLRQYPDGSQMHKINLNDRELLGSEYFFLRPNDVIYAEPLKVRELGSGTSLIQNVVLITSTLTSIALIFTLLQ
jgi:polysaccharide export outer membrane protein